MNTNPYPKGRWTSPKFNDANPVRPNLADSSPRLEQARLSELFWATNESPILFEAEERIERLLHAATSAAA
jgi:hypothetical protein